MIVVTGAWVVGYPVDLEVTGAPASTSVRFVYGTNLVLPGACPAYTAPNCLDVRPVRTIGFDTSDASGLASLSPVVPPITAARIELQATTSGPGNVQSNSIVVTVHQAASDNDSDGLTAADEVSIWGTDPGAADTDLDGLLDGDEALTYSTDPLAADTDADGLLDGDEIDRGSDPLDPASPPTWTADISPLFQVECAGCHTGGGASGGLSLDLYANVVDAPSIDVPAMDRIEPFDLAASYLLHKLAGTQASVGGSGVRMPRGGPYFDATEMALVEEWILTGALE